MRISDWSSDVCSSDLRDALVAFGIKAQRPRRLGDIADQLRLDALKAFFDGRVVRLVPRRVDDIDLAQCLDAVARPRVGAALGRIVVLAHRIAEFQILELLEKVQASAPADPLLRQIFSTARVDGTFRPPGTSQAIPEASPLTRP